MRRVRHRDTGPELQIRRALWRKGFRYRVNYKAYGVSVDIAFPARKVAVFVDGCFWHGCPAHYVAPLNNFDIWRRKYERNRDRDAKNSAKLEAEGWQVVRIWSHTIRKDLDCAVGLVGERVGRVIRLSEPLEFPSNSPSKWRGDSVTDLTGRLVDPRRHLEVIGESLKPHSFTEG